MKTLKKFKKGDLARVINVMGWEGCEVEILVVDEDDDINPYYCQDINDEETIYMSEENLENL